MISKAAAFFFLNKRDSGGLFNTFNFSVICHRLMNGVLDYRIVNQSIVFQVAGIDLQVLEAGVGDCVGR